MDLHITSIRFNGIDVMVYKSLLGNMFEACVMSGRIGSQQGLVSTSLSEEGRSSYVRNDVIQVTSTQEFPLRAIYAVYEWAKYIIKNMLSYGVFHIVQSPLSQTQAG
jgi:hypothetical protein